MEWLNQYFEDKDNFPRPNWENIYEHVDIHFSDSEQNELWCNIARTWMEKLKTVLPKEYDIYESDNFILVTSESEKYISIFQNYLERSLKRTIEILQGIASDDGYGKYIVLVFNDIDDYYSYLSYFYSEDGEYGLSSGIYLNKGYGHFAFPHQELTYAESIAAHELTHALLAHLPIPAWLNEGIAITIENQITGSAPLTMNDEMYTRHKSFWGEKEIQEFWSGDSFHRTDEGQELSYHLAQFAVNSLSQEYETFIQFVNNANLNDGGEIAANETYGGSLGNLISQYFGEGNWAPNPSKWKTLTKSSSGHPKLRGFCAFRYRSILAQKPLRFGCP